jgi:hypothetical protein
MAPHTPTLERLDDQITWYSEKSRVNQRWFTTLKVAGIMTAAAIPFAAGMAAPAWLTGGLGVVVVVLEGTQNLFQFQQNWIAYRSTCEGLKHEKFLWLAKAGPYATTHAPDALLAERVEALIAREHAKWLVTREQGEKEQQGRRD